MQEVKVGIELSSGDVRSVTAYTWLSIEEGKQTLQETWTLDRFVAGMVAGFGH